MKLVDGTLYVKIVFFGPAMAGKTEVMKTLFLTVLNEEEKGGPRLKQVNTTSGRTLLFDFAPVRLGADITCRLFSVSGQNYYRSTRSYSMADTDAVFLILDAQEEVMERNKLACEELLHYMGTVPTMRNAPVITLVNKWEMRNALPVFSISRQLELTERRWPCLSINALEGSNIGRAFDMMKRLLRPHIYEFSRQSHTSFDHDFFPPKADLSLTSWQLN